MKYILLLFVGLLCSCKNAHVIDINTFNFPEASTIYIGEGNANDIVVPGLPDSALRIQYFNGSFNWEMLKPCYLQVNGENPNKIVLDTVKTITIRGISYKIADIKNVISHYSDKKCPDYINIANVIRKIDSSFTLTQDSIHTVICPKQKTKFNCIILLDTIVHVTTNNLLDKRLKDTGSSTLSATLSFFRVTNSNMVADVPEDTKSFHDGSMFYFTYAKPLFTSFGASEISFSHSVEKEIVTNFDIYYRAVISKNIWYAQNGAITGIPISVSQQTNMNFMANDLYLPHFSSTFAPVLGEINTSGEFILNNALKKNARDYDIGYQFFFWNGPFLILVMAIIYIVLFSIYYKKRELSEVDFNTERGTKKNYFSVILFILTIFLLIKIYIGYNLSFTYPYLVTYWPASSAIAPLILTAVFIGWLFINELMSDRMLIGKKILILIALLFTVGIYCYFHYYLKSLHFPGLFPDMLHCWSAPIPASIYALIIFNVLVILNAIVYSFLGKKYLLVIFLGPFFLGLLVIGFTQKSSISIASLLVSACLVIGFCWWWPFSSLRSFILFSLFILMVPLLAAFYQDFGYMVVSIAFLPLLVPILYKFKTLKDSSKWDKDKGTVRLTIAYIIFVSIMIAAGGYLLNKNNGYDPSKSAISNTERIEQRAVVFFDFDKFASYGLRETEGKAQFFAVMSKYTLPHEHDNFIPIHRAISGFRDPIVRNDLSFPFGFIYPFKTYWLVPLFIITLLWLILAYQVLSKSFGTKNRDGNYFFTSFMYLRIFALSLLVSSGVYLICSYYGLVPFTGRLIYGLGQDSFAEVIETTLIFIIFGLMPKAEAK